MAGKMGKFVIIFFVASICLTSMVSAVDAEINPTIQVGLFYGQNALPGANLENYAGSGYRLGYFDEDLHFVTLGHTPETQISMVKTQNVSLSNGNYVDGTGSVTVGCYHLQMPGSYPDFESAAAAAEKGVDRIYIDFVKALCEFLVENGRRPMFWGDVICGFPEMIKELPEENQRLNWGYAKYQREEETKWLCSSRSRHPLLYLPT